MYDGRRELILMMGQVGKLSSISFLGSFHLFSGNCEFISVQSNCPLQERGGEKESRTTISHIRKPDGSLRRWLPNGHLPTIPAGGRKGNPPAMGTDHCLAVRAGSSFRLRGVSSSQLHLCWQVPSQRQCPSFPALPPPSAA